MTSTTTARWQAGTPAGQGGRFRAQFRSSDEVELRPGADEAVAANPGTPAKTLTRLSYSKDELVRLAVAGNTNTPVADLQRMLNRGRDVRAIVLANPSLPEKDLISVARHPRDGDLRALAANPALTANAIRAAMETADSGVRNMLLSHKAAPADLAAMRAPERTQPEPVSFARPAREVVGDPDASPEELRNLAYTRDARLRERVATHPNTPQRILEGYLRLDHQTLLQVLRNPSLSEAAIMDRFARPIIDTRTALGVAATRPEMTERFAQFVLDSWIAQGGFSMVQRVPALLAGNPSTPPSVLRELSGWREPEVQQALAGNPAAAPAAA
ncbi:hypothetical protein [Curtobacterium sp. MCSS17_016]|uniref:hypothetical protein n=1 Tax=Curtobacterium sp. MCSS17_016 TaxID=2175644 RepID=UPI000DA78FC4|nr:hypothetical protein [Curtobacterium sp. MCSS17_016]WIE81134.1 hypothetical protein DEJ19_021905 [Curtobacterium sp. MCSS17_016]